MNPHMVTTVRKFSGYPGEKPKDYMRSLNVAEKGLRFSINDEEYLADWKLEAFKSNLLLEDYEELIKSFISRFHSTGEPQYEAQRKAVSQLNSWCQGDLTLAEYLQKTRDLARRTPSSLENLLAVQFIGGLADERIREMTSWNLSNRDLDLNSPSLSLEIVIECAQKASGARAMVDVLKASNQMSQLWQAAAAKAIPHSGQHRAPRVTDMPALSETHSASGSSVGSSKSDSNDIIRGLQKEMQELRMNYENLRARQVPHNPGSGWANNVGNGNATRGPVGTADEASPEELDEAVREIRESYLIEARRSAEVFAAEANPRKRVNIEDLMNEGDEPVEPLRQPKATSKKKAAIRYPIKGMAGVTPFDLLGAMRDPTLGPHMSYMQYLDESPRGRAILLDALKSSRPKVVRKKKVGADGMYVANAYAVDGTCFPGAKIVEVQELVPKTFMAASKVNGTAIELVVDGGSMVNLMHQSEIDILGLTFIEDETMSIRVADGRWIALKGYVEAMVTVSSVTQRVRFWILHTRKSYRALLSKSWLIQCKAWASFEDDYYIIRGKDNIGHVVAPVGGIVPTYIPDVCPNRMVNVPKEAVTKGIARGSYRVDNEESNDDYSGDEEDSADDYDLEEESDTDCFIVEVALTKDVRRMRGFDDEDISSITVEAGSSKSETDDEPDGNPKDNPNPKDFPSAAISPLVAMKLRAALVVEGVTSALSGAEDGSERIEKGRTSEVQLDKTSRNKGYEMLAGTSDGVVEREVSTGRI
ncbi:hypothetical protein G7K_6499-t1 [Saitoella complicata NRRL Y-17804]|uniref:Retrotransposon gag domain-containing protein n=1 Tax=Saitoella complicata (strain BCRC 22490 / CBS 7301 / JCM 7358 / NBRC 10748 / NRRL Y-17804) TaxID=698492 RepID=A0A0E9NRX5_SAICN|nr:hypothetical protein G7K_6499-t1 [Saitoella complicata NRRL Y-17804]